MNKNKILKYWNSRASKKFLKCTNDKNLESFETDYFLSVIKKKSTVLDIGCGEGQLLKKLQNKKNCNCYGIDFSPNLIKIAKKKTKNVSFYCLDMTKINKEFFRRKV